MEWTSFRRTHSDRNSNFGLRVQSSELKLRAMNILNKNNIYIAQNRKLCLGCKPVNTSGTE